MACYTMVRVTIDDNAINRKARKALGYSETGTLTPRQAQAVKVEAGVIKARREIKRMIPAAIIKRKGNHLSIIADV